ncbi:MAG: hypothetical protein SF029_06045 [bacterium]|nr:hypothetical protein [bacterium]
MTPLLIHHHRRAAMLIRLLLVVLIGLLALPALGQEAAELPEIPYYSASDPAARFNVPIPAGWADQSTAEMAHFVNGDLQADIYALVVPNTDALVAVETALAQVLPDETVAERYYNAVTLSNGAWLEALYTTPEGGSVTAFGQTRGDQTYVLIYVSRAVSDFFMLVTQPEVNAEGRYEVEAGIEEAINDLYPGESHIITETDTVQLSNGEWTRFTFEPRNDLPLRAIAQARSDAVYIVVENGSEGFLESANKVFYTVFFGWFVTPYNDPYLYLGLGATAVIVVGLIGSIALRYRNLQKEAALVAQLQQSA